MYLAPFCPEERKHCFTPQLVVTGTRHDLYTKTDTHKPRIPNEHYSLSHLVSLYQQYTVNTYTHIHLVHAFRVEKLTAYSKSPIGILSAGNLESVPLVLICPKPFAKPYKTFDRPVCFRCVIALSVRVRKSSGIVTGTSVEVLAETICRSFVRAGRRSLSGNVSKHVSMGSLSGIVWVDTARL